MAGNNHNQGVGYGHHFYDHAKHLFPTALAPTQKAFGGYVWLDDNNIVARSPITGLRPVIEQAIATVRKNNPNLTGQELESEIAQTLTGLNDWENLTSETQTKLMILTGIDFGTMSASDREKSINHLLHSPLPFGEITEPLSKDVKIDYGYTHTLDKTKTMAEDLGNGNFKITMISNNNNGSHTGHDLGSFVVQMGVSTSIARAIEIGNAMVINTNNNDRLYLDKAARDVLEGKTELLDFSMKMPHDGGSGQTVGQGHNFYEHASHLFKDLLADNQQQYGGYEWRGSDAIIAKSPITGLSPVITQAINTVKTNNPKLTGQALESKIAQTLTGLNDWENLTTETQNKLMIEAKIDFRSMTKDQREKTLNHLLHSPLPFGEITEQLSHDTKIYYAYTHTLDKSKTIVEDLGHHVVKITMISNNNNGSHTGHDLGSFTIKLRPWQTLEEAKEIGNSMVVNTNNNSKLLLDQTARQILYGENELERISGTDGDDFMYDVATSNNRFSGGDGRDVFVVDGNSQDYRIYATEGGSVKIVKGDSYDYLDNVELIHFKNETIDVSRLTKQVETEFVYAEKNGTLVRHLTSGGEEVITKAPYYARAIAWDSKNDDIYFGDYYGKVYRYEVSEDKYTLLADLKVTTTEWHRGLTAMAFDGDSKVYIGSSLGVGGSHKKTLSILDTKSGTITQTIDLTSHGIDFQGGITMLGGDLYYAGYTLGYGLHILKYDLETGAVTEVTKFAGNTKYIKGLVTGSDGYLYARQFYLDSQNFTLRIDPETGDTQVVGVNRTGTANYKFHDASSAHYEYKPDTKVNLPNKPGDTGQGVQKYYHDDPNKDEYVTGQTKVDAFVIKGNSADYGWGLTADKKGVVVWTKDGFDILFDMEYLKFNDKYVDLRPLGATGSGGDGGGGNGGGANEKLYQDVASETQYLTGTTDNDIFVIKGKSSDFGWDKTQDGKGIVVWNGKQFDVLTGFEAIRFDDKTVQLKSSDGGGGGGGTTEKLYQDVASETQYLTGTTDNDIFVIKGKSSEFGWDKTQDGKGIVVWNGKQFDVLTGFEAIRFDDKTVQLKSSDGGGSGGSDKVTKHLDIADKVQHIQGGEGKDEFVISGKSSDFGWGKTQDGKDFVVWNDQTHDILHDVEQIRFDDTVIDLTA